MTLTRLLNNARMVCMNVLKWFIKRFLSRNRQSSISQSWLAWLEGRLETEEEHEVVIAFVNGKAWWITDQGLVIADATEEGIDFSTAKLYNAIEADQEELNMVQYIVDQLVERNK